MKMITFLHPTALQNVKLWIAITLTMEVARVFASYSSSAMQDQILELPRGPPLNFSTFSGYLSVGQYDTDKNVTKMIHYIYTESQSDPANHPLIFWTNGTSPLLSLIHSL
jgi:carboxypeptidase C (cathepsin A)